MRARAGTQFRLQSGGLKVCKSGSRGEPALSSGSLFVSAVDSFESRLVAASNRYVPQIVLMPASVQTSLSPSTRLTTY